MPHGIKERRWAEIAWAFAHGGYVSVYEADAFLLLERGTCKQAALDGQIPFRARPRGRYTRYIVKAADAERLFGTRRRTA